MIVASQLQGGYVGQAPIIQNVSFQVKKGQFYALLGPNGSGKSTLLKMITGVLPLLGGQVHIDGRLLSAYSTRERAEMTAVLSQDEQVAFDFSVAEIVMLGRYPHQKGWIKSITREDQDVVQSCMQQAGVWALRNKMFHTLSGGEKQRVLLAKTFAQQPRILLLDEPTNHLDIRHTYEMLDLLKERQVKEGLTVVAILHDLNIAALYADNVGILHEGQLLHDDGIQILHDNDLLKQVYGVQTMTQNHPIFNKPQIFVIPRSSSFRKD